MTTMVDAAGVVHQVAVEMPRILATSPAVQQILISLGLSAQLLHDHESIYCAPLLEEGVTGHYRATADPIKLTGFLDDEIRGVTHAVVDLGSCGAMTQLAVQAMAAQTFAPHVISVQICTPFDEVNAYHLLGRIFNRQAHAAQIQVTFDSALTEVRHTAWPKRRILYCTGQNPWTTVTRLAYPAALLGLVNWQTWPEDETDITACAGGNCARPYTPDTPELAFRWTEELVHTTDMIVLSSTSSSGFTEAHADALERQTGNPVALVDGTRLTWQGNAPASNIHYLMEVAREWL
jgi:hypothetical protein